MKYLIGGVTIVILCLASYRWGFHQGRAAQDEAIERERAANQAAILEYIKANPERPLAGQHLDYPSEVYERAHRTTTRAN